MESVNWNVLGGLDGPTSVFVAGKAAVAALIVAAVIGLLFCFFGLKLLRVFNVLLGFCAGFVIGFAAAFAFGLETKIVLAAALAAGLVIGALGGFFLKFGAFWVCLVTVSSMMTGILQPQNWILAAVCAGIGLLAAIAAMIWFEPLVIIATAAFGGFTVGNAAAGLAGLENPILIAVISVVVAAIGIAVQFALKSSEINKKEVKRAKAIKEEISKEAEIEQARNILDDDEDED